MRYLLDANIIIHFHHYTPRDVHPGLWDALEELIERQCAFLQRECLDELARGDDDLAAWAKKQNGFVLDASDNEVIRVAQISNIFPGWVQQQKNAADPWMIACCEANNLVLVTDENRKGLNTSPQKMTIPTAVALLASPVACWKSLEMQRHERWQFARV